MEQVDPTTKSYQEPLAPQQIVFVAPPAFPLNPDGQKIAYFPIKSQNGSLPNPPKEYGQKLMDTNSVQIKQIPVSCSCQQWIIFAIFSFLFYLFIMLGIIVTPVFFAFAGFIYLAHLCIVCSVKPQRKLKEFKHSGVAPITDIIQMIKNQPGETKWNLACYHTVRTSTGTGRNRRTSTRTVYTKYANRDIKYPQQIDMTPYYKGFEDFSLVQYNLNLDIGFNNYPAIQNYQNKRVEWLSKEKADRNQKFTATNTTPNFKHQVLSYDSQKKSFPVLLNPKMFVVLKFFVLEWLCLAYLYFKVPVVNIDFYKISSDADI